MTMLQDHGLASSIFAITEMDAGCSIVCHSADGGADVSSLARYVLG